MIVVGTQGWNYDAWIGPLYPARSRADELLGMYARLFQTVELDATFYAAPSATVTQGWIDRTPPGFTFSTKLLRRITHECRLREVELDLDLYCQQIRTLGDRLASVLIQLPPDFSPTERGHLEAFLSLLPSDIRFAIEFRDGAWLSAQTMSLLERHAVALALVDGEWLPRSRVFEYATHPTAGFAYVRWMGSRAITDHSHVQVDRDEDLEAWARLIKRLEPSFELVMAYFSNFFQGHAPASARRLQTLLGQHPVDPDLLVAQPSLF